MARFLPDERGVYLFSAKTERISAGVREMLLGFRQHDGAEVVICLHEADKACCYCENKGDEDAAGGPGLLVALAQNPASHHVDKYGCDEYANAPGQFR